MIWRSISYDAAGAALLILAVPFLLGAFILLYRYRQRRLNAFMDKSLASTLVEQRDVASFWIKALLACVVWICAVLTLMQPKGNERYVTSKLQGANAPERMQMHDVILLIDASASMGAKDASGRTRETVAKEIADGIISKLSGENVALYAFTSATMQIVPLTNDYLFTRLMLRDLQINADETSGTDLKQALEFLNKQYFSLPNHIPKSLVLLTDGGDTAYEASGTDSERAMNSILAPIQESGKQHLKIYTVGIGSSQGAEVPNVKYQGKAVISAVNGPLLRKISEVGQGRLFLSEQTPPAQITTEIASEIARQNTYRSNGEGTGNISERVYDLYFQYPLGLGLLALGLFLLIPDTRKRRLR